MPNKQEPIWRTPEEIVEIAFQRASVVMMNEAHDGWRRCIRTRQIGKRILPVAHQAGVRHMAMEALFPALTEKGNRRRAVPEGEFGYVSQPEMKALIQAALDLGWTLIAYEADEFQWLSARHGIQFTDSENPYERYQQYKGFGSELMSMEYTNWREEQQALNIVAALQSLPAGTPLLVWCGNGHLSKRTLNDWSPMGYQFQEHSGMNPFVIDQTRTVNFHNDTYSARLVKKYSGDLARYDGTAGFLRDEAPAWFGQNTFADAFLFSTQNELE
jgi:hypothetical protein